MPADPAPLEARLDAFESRLGKLEARLAELERTAPGDGRGAPRAPAQGRAAHAGTAGANLQQTATAAATPDTPILTLLGRSLVVLGGAFLLRWITEAGTVPQVAGTVAGLGYAILWTLIAERAAGRGRLASATFHGLVGALIAFPLVVEATLKFHFLSSQMGAVALLATSALGLGVSWRRSIGHLAWIVTLGTIAAALVMAVTSRNFFPFSLLLLLLGFASLWLGYGRGWVALAGVVALVANAQVFFLSLVPGSAARAGVTPIIAGIPLLTLQLGLVGLYFGSFAWRTLRRARDLQGLEILQSTAVFIVGLGGSMMLVRTTGSFGTFVGIVTLCLAVGCYAVSFTSIDRQAGSRRNFLFYSTVALVLTVIALHTLLAGEIRALIFALVSVPTAWIGSRRQRATLSGHGAFFAVAAAVEAGLPQRVATAFFGLDAGRSPEPDATTFVVIVVTMLNCWFDVAKHGRTWGRFSVVPKLVVLSVLCASVGAVLVRALALALAVPEGASPDRAVTAAIRTGVLALSALLVAALSRWRRCLEAAWLVYPVLIFGGVKLLLEDLRHGRPATVFASLVLYGSALILAPRLARRIRSAALPERGTGKSKV